MNMNYLEGINHMRTLSSETGSFSPYEGIVIHYPGYKRRGDYRLTVQGGNAPTHSNISRKLYDLIANKTYNFQQLKNFLIDVYTNGTYTRYSEPTLSYLQHLIYWITLQEEINYPRSEGYAGINLPFCRFLEAIYSTKDSSNFTIEVIETRCNNHGRTKPNLYSLEGAPFFYHY